jgi:hypothetical protein
VSLAAVQKGAQQCPHHRCAFDIRAEDHYTEESVTDTIHEAQDRKKDCESMPEPFPVVKLAEQFKKKITHGPTCSVNSIASYNPENLLIAMFPITLPSFSIPSPASYGSPPSLNAISTRTLASSGVVISIFLLNLS